MAKPKPTKSPADLFEEHFPSLTDAEMAQAAKADRIVLSLNLIPAVPGKAAVVKFKLATGGTETMVLDRHVAEVLRAAIEKLDEADWQWTQTKPPGETQH